MKTILSCILFICSIITSETMAQKDILKETGKKAIGRWQSISGEMRLNKVTGQKSYLKREFLTQEKTTEGRFTFYTDSTFTQPSMRVVFGGPYSMVGINENVPGAVNGNFEFAYLKLTPLNEYATQWLNSGKPNTCGTGKFETNKEKDTTPTKGCALLNIFTDGRSTEYDLVKVEGDLLYYGTRPEDGSGLDSPSKRPKALQVAVKRMK